MEVHTGLLDKEITVLGDCAGLDSKRTGDEVEDCNNHTNSSESENALKTDHLQRLYMVFIEQNLLVCKLETIYQKRNNQHQITN